MPLPSQPFSLPPRILAAYVAVLIVLFLFFALIAHLTQSNQSWTGFKILNDVEISRELLAQKFSGAQYFQTGEETAQTPPPYISAINARTQMERIVKARQLSPDASRHIEELIGKLTAAPSSRAADVYHVNILQLNLELDKLR